MTGARHLSTTVLDGYLHHTLPPRDHQQVQVHLDRCEPCWQTWNRHRWNAARPNPLYTQLAEFLGTEFTPYFDSSRALAAEWDTASPRTDHDIAQFFRTSTSYLYNLAIWEASGNRPDYLAHALPILARHGTRTVLDYGCGIGSDTIALHHLGFRVIGCDFHSPSTAFLRWRSEHTIPVIEPGQLDSITEVDTLWVIDTLDHLTDIETSLGALLSTVSLVITENLSITRAHGRQRFHHRRPFPEFTALFAHHGLIPNTAAAGTPIIHWTPRGV
jgi:2-polyprenyl-3-methyl-5-hydroxy-6-metoxy-1,4-benzoquinol methylase